MRTHFHGPTYTVEFDENDTAYFVHNTDADPEEIFGHGAFVFDSVSGDLLDAKGAGAGRKESMQWLAFSQDAQDHARQELAQHGVHVNPFDFAFDMPELHNPSCARKKNGCKPEIGRTVVIRNPGRYPLCARPGEEGRISNIDEDGGVHVEWDGGGVSSIAADDDWLLPQAWNPKDITRTRGAKTMRGPYTARKGYKPWIRMRGKLGEGFLTTMSEKQRTKALDRCVDAHGYPSCLHSIMALERAKTGPRGKGKGVGVKYASELKAARDYLRETYGGRGSFTRERGGMGTKAADVGPGYFANPEAEEHKRRAYGYLQNGEDAAKRGMYHYRRAKAGGVPGAAANEASAACRYAQDAQRFGVLAMHELKDAVVAPEEIRTFQEMAESLALVSTSLLRELGCLLG